jgi:large subunit ribosomal protein L19e
VELNKVKLLGARTLGVGAKRVVIKDEARAAEAITREDVRTLVKEGAIEISPLVGTSRGRARVLAEKKKKGRRMGHGSRKGTKKARTNKKGIWMRKVRAQRRKLKELKPKNYRELYLKVKGGFFKNVKHLEAAIKGGDADV